MVKNRITPEYLGEIAKDMLRVLEEEGIVSINTLEKKLGQSFDAKEGKIKLESRPSELDTWASTASYVIQGKGIPIEVRMNSRLEYSMVIVKTEKKIEGYNPFFYDPRGNIIQHKKTDFSWEKIREELLYLAQF